jgi:outer membrane lipoprotein SlyB
MKLLCATLLCLTVIAAHAGETAAAARAPAQVHGVKLASICDACGVVSQTTTETRAGKPNGVGAVGGAVVGGVVGHQIGGGGGKTAATVLGALGGGVAGNAIEKKAKKVTVWITTVTFKDGSTATYEHASDPGFDAGDVVRIDHGQPVKHTS